MDDIIFNLRECGTMKVFVFLLVISSLLIYQFAPFMVVVTLFPILWIVSLLAWILYNGMEIYHMVYVFYHHKTQIVIPEEEKMSLLEILGKNRDSILSGNAIPFLLYSLFYILIFGMLLPIWVCSVLGMFTYLVHVYLRIISMRLLYNS